ncbi:MAG: Fpg/Nei family DNA glycosylase [Candidatus Microbacterium phytovorans]|uniref:Fpg/Nei family DNA glycosylase n=1 Tax=Candidatus Microbacterium phytovorans TaxID=3121374 RepID=A0AAJ6B4F4_9MICO|nr:DNA-formamidopyrimidine glycosylase family protein [Microbacterium sp.]WEK12726.1 MAG: Fpg/Nei family DNA glycosylase [Microbacterium sp.]
MPESPEVEVLARFVRERAVGRLIDAVELDEFRALKTRARPLGELAGRAVTDVTRHGKHLAVATDGAVLVVSFGRAGWLRWEPAGEAAASAGLSDTVTTAPAPTETAPAAAPIGRLTLDDGEAFVLTDAGTWLSFGLSVVDDAAEVAAIAKLGPDPLDDAFALTDLERVVAGRRKQLKAVLQEQESLAGIGNAYSDEILHVARLYPLRHAGDLDEGERARLFAAIREVLTGALADRSGAPIAELKARKVASMRVHGRTGEHCPVCGGLVADVPGSKGAAQYCPVCQLDGEHPPAP